MPVEVKGVKELHAALLRFDPELKKEWDKLMRNAMLPIRDAAQGFVPNVPPGLSGWTHRRKFATDTSYRPFPRFDPSMVRHGIVYRAGANKANRNGFQSLFYVANTSAAGAIYETAGRKSPYGQPWTGPTLGGGGSHNESHSTNPDAGTHFVQSLPPLYGKNKHRGRLIYKAWEKDQGKAQDASIKAIQNACDAFNRIGQSNYTLAA